MKSRINMLWIDVTAVIFIHWITQVFHETVDSLALDD